jgi:hypothetical protein
MTRPSRSRGSGPAPDTYWQRFRPPCGLWLGVSSSASQPGDRSALRIIMLPTSPAGTVVLVRLMVRGVFISGFRFIARAHLTGKG